MGDFAPRGSPPPSPPSTAGGPDIPSCWSRRSSRQIGECGMDANKMIRASHKYNMRWMPRQYICNCNFASNCNPLGHSPTSRRHVVGAQPKLYGQTDRVEPLLKRRPPPSEHEYSIAAPLKICLQLFNELQHPRGTARRSARRRRRTTKIIWAKRSRRAASSALRLAVRAGIFHRTPRR